MRLLLPDRATAETISKRSDASRHNTRARHFTVPTLRSVRDVHGVTGCVRSRDVLTYASWTVQTPDSLTGHQQLLGYRQDCLRV